MLFQQEEILTFPNPIHSQSTNREDEVEVICGYRLCFGDFCLVASGAKIQAFCTYKYIYKYFCLFMECFCMVRAPVQNDEGWLRLRK